MASRKKRSSAPIVRIGGTPARRSRGRIREGDASFPVPPPRSDLPRGYAETLGEIKQRIQQERLRVVMTANSAMVLLYWDIGRMILDRQEREGWGAKVIDRLSVDLREAYPDMQGPLTAQPQIHALLRYGVAGPGNCATIRCTIAMASEHRLDRTFA